MICCDMSTKSSDNVHLYKNSTKPIKTPVWYNKYTKIQNNIHEKKYSWWTSCCSCRSGQRFSSTSHLIFSIAMHRGKNILECRTHPMQWSAVMPSHVAFVASNRDIWYCGLWSYTFHLHAQKKNYSIGYRNGEYGERNSTVILSCAANHSFLFSNLSKSVLVSTSPLPR